MSIQYNSVVPWGRSYDEYVHMFNLTEDDLKKKMLGCGDGPASFNFELTQKGGNIVSIDPIYQMSKNEIKQRINETYQDVINQTKSNLKQFNWASIKNIEELTKIRLNSMNKFLDDFESGLLQKRYIFAKLPELPFSDNQFDLSLSSHFLFLYSDNLNFDFHLKSIKEMLRVSKEARIFPIMDLNSKVSPYLEKIQIELDKEKIRSEIVKVNYEFQKGANQMLKIQKL